MFRGFNKRSGGNPHLNNPTAITPHAFYGIPKETQDSRWIGSTIKALFGPHRQFSPPNPVGIDKMSYNRLRTEVCGHLRGDKNMISHFSSWTADLQTAMNYANGGSSPHIGVLDTQMSGKDNEIMHVNALWEAGLSKWRFPYEYLVYGPVKGKSYTCMTLAWQIYPTDLCFNLWNMLSPEPTLAHIWTACDRVGRHSFFQAGSAWFDVLLGTCKSWELTLTVIAAEWGRSKVKAGRIPARTTLAEMDKMVSDLSWIIERAARSPNLVLPLHNPHTYKDYLPGVEYMLDLLSSIESEVGRRRSRPQSESSSFIGFFWPRKSCQKRKANGMEPIGDSETSSETAKK